MNALISPKEALEIILGHVRPLKIVEKPLGKCFGHCLAGEVRSDHDQPAADRSAMDGFAVRSADLAGGGGLLELVGEVAAGSSKRPRVVAGSCVRVLTGANIPPGADAVVKLEQTRESDKGIKFLESIQAGANIRKKGEEASKGTVLLKKGTMLGAVQIGVAASAGKAKLRVYARPRIAVLCTGEELRSASERVGAHQLRDSNGPSLCAVLGLWHYPGVVQRIVPDDPKLLAAKIKRTAASYDLIILSGGVSVGKYDYVPEAVEKIGAKIRFHGIAMRPGKPQLYASLGGNRHIFGLPGNPLSVLTGFHEFTLPALRRLGGTAVESCQPCMPLALAAEAKPLPDLVRYVLAKLIPNRNGLMALPLESHGSADLIAANQADGVVVLPRSSGKIAAGTVVEFRPWRPLP